jgi:hypothetical protein
MAPQIMSSTNLKYVRGEINARQYLDVVLSECDLSESTDSCDGLDQEVRSTISKAFWLLDELDRSDPFWVPGNGLPTITKLHEYSKYQIKQGIDVGFWSWLHICISYFHFASFLDSKLWGAVERVNIKWLVRTSWNYHHYSGSESSSSLASVLKSLEIVNTASSELEEVAKLSNESESWVSNVKAYLPKP